MAKTPAGKARQSKPPETATTDAAARTDEPHSPRQLGYYEVLEKIGQGGMAVVYKGVQPSLNRSVAIKVLPPQFVATPELLGRFDREASIVSQLNHSNIVQVIDRGKEDDTLYIVMEYVDGKSLADLIHGKSLDVATVIDYAIQICEGLEYAHSMGVVHRDLKPSNILIDGRNGRVKIADFGIAQLETTGGAVATLTYDGASIGTMNYMSPEQRLDAHTVNHLTDIFSFGVILYQMLTGKLPIGHFKAPSILRPDLPLGLDAIVRKCLAEAPADRYQGAGEIRRELAKLTRMHHKIEESAILSFSRLNKRQRWYAMGGAAAVLLLILVGLAVRWTRRAPDTPTTSVATVRNAAQTALPSPAVEPAASGNAGQVSVVEAGLQADFARAEGLAAGGKRQEAVDVLSRAVAEYPHSPQAPRFQFAIAEQYYAMGEKERCKTAYDRVVRNYPKSELVPRAIVGRCQAEWDTAPRRGLLRTAHDSDVQRRLIEELSILAKSETVGDVLPDALRLIAEIAEAPDLSDTRLAAETLLRLDQLNPAGNPNALFHAAELFDKKLGAPIEARDAYKKFINAFPSDGRVEAVQRRLEELKPMLPQDPEPDATEPAGAEPAATP